VDEVFPPTVIIRHTKENPRKCSIMPLKGRPGIQIYNHPMARPLDLRNYIRLAAEGPPLSREDEQFGVLLLDGSWRSADSMSRDFEHVSPRSLSGFVTAYPRVSKLGTDPDNGLASVEALFIALKILGRPVEGLLDHYHWRDKFLAANSSLLANYD